MMAFVRGWGVFSIVFALASAGLSLFAFRFDDCKTAGEDKYPGGFTLPVIALELPPSGGDLTKLLASPQCRDRQARALVLDSFVNIPLYGIWLAGMSFLFIRSRGLANRLAGIASLITLIVAVICDYTENHFMGIAIEHQGSFTDQMAAQIRGPSMIKWFAIFLTVALLSTLFIRIGLSGSIAGWAVAACFLVSFVIDLAALAYRLPLLELVFLPLLPAIALIAYLFLWKPELVRAALGAGDT
jgi:hypothetical protein